MKEAGDFPAYVEENGDWSFYRPVLCQFVTSERIPGDAYMAEQVQDVFPHGDTYMPDTGMKAKNDPMPDPVWSSRTEFEAYVRDLGEFNILDYEELSFDNEDIDDEIISIERAGTLEGRDIYLLISETDERVKARDEPYWQQHLG